MVMSPASRPSIRLTIPTLTVDNNIFLPFGFGNFSAGDVEEEGEDEPFVVAGPEELAGDIKRQRQNTSYNIACSALKPLASQSTRFIYLYVTKQMLLITQLSNCLEFKLYDKLCVFENLTIYDLIQNLVVILACQRHL